MSDKTNSQIPQIRPTQFGNSENNLFTDSVNLFRGDVNLSLDLVALKGRNQLDVKVTASYGSNVKNEIDQSNVSAPTGILGLGWKLPFDRIEVDERGNASQGDNVYQIYINNSATELVRTTSEWKRATLSNSSINALNQGKVDVTIQSQFIDAGLAIDSNASAKTIEQNRQWKITDIKNQRIFIVENKDSQLSVYSGGAAFECFQYDFSKIIYYSEFERWEIVKDDGTSYFYGGMTPNQNAIQWKVRWGNWSGQSALTHSQDNTLLQSRYPSAWNLAQVENLWGDTISFRYDVVEQRVGEKGLYFTKACYLTTITDMFNRTVNLNYKEKQYDINNSAAPREYLSPHDNTPYTQVPKNDPGPYQDRYETRYLDNIVVNNAQGTLLYSVQLSYDSTSNFSHYEKNNALYGDTVKRTLTSIQRRYANHCALPALQLSYWPPNAVNAGALSSAITPDGAEITYRYKQQTLPLCDRQRQISNPWPRAAKPRIWFGADYVVSVWLNESTDQIHVTLYTWLGRWQQWIPKQQIIKAAFDINSVNVITGTDFACLTYSSPQNGKSWVHVYHKDNRKWGEWLEAAPIGAETAHLQLAAGDNFLITCDGSHRILMRYTWDAFSKVWITENRSGDLPVGKPNNKPFITAANKHYAVLDYDSQSSDGRRNPLTLYYQDSDNHWQTGASTTLAFTIGGYRPESSFGFTSSASFIALTYITQEASLSVDYIVKAVEWDENFNAITSHDFPCKLPKSNPSKVITIPFLARFVNNSMIASGPYLLRYNGKAWLFNKSLYFRDTCTDQDINWYAYGGDYAIAVSNRESAVQAKLLAYDPTTQITRWDNTPTDLYSKDGPTSSRKIHFFPTAGADIATMGNRIYHRGSWCNWQDAVGQYQEVPYEIDSTTMINQGPRFISYLNLAGSAAKNTSVWPFKNQILANEDVIAQRYFTQIDANGSLKANVNGQYPAGLSTFVTYQPLDKNFDSAETLTLNRYLDNTLQGSLVDYCVDSVSINDGYTTSTTKYVFDLNSATCDPTGTVFKYYKSTCYPGTETTSTPRFGYTENHYFNGLTAQNTASSQKVRAADSDASGLLDGQLIEQKTFDSRGNVLIHEQKRIEVFTTQVQDGVPHELFGGYLRCISNTTINDGLLATTNYVYDSQFGKVIEEAFDNVTRDGTIETVGKHYDYAYQSYPWFLFKNVIDVPFTQFDSVVTPAPGTEKELIGGSLQQYTAYARRDPTSGAPAPTVWAANDAYVLQQAIDDIAASNPRFTDADPGTQWQIVNRVLHRNFYGAITCQKNATEQIDSTLWDSSAILPVAEFTSAGEDECDFVGFEPYETYLTTWQLARGKGKLPDYIISGDAHTGSRSFKLAGGSTLARTTPLQQSQTTIVSGWIKAEKGFHANTGDVYLETRSGSGSVKKTIITPSSEGVWLYWQVVVEASSVTRQPLTVALVNDKSTASLLINNISITPLVSTMKATFYDLTYWDETATLGNNADIMRYGYDPLRQKFTEIGPQENSKKGAVSYATRSWNTAQPFIYPQNDPSSSCDILPAEGGLYETFMNGEQTWDRWQRDSASAWHLDNGQLSHRNATLNSITWLPTQQQGSYAVGCTLTSSAPQAVSFAIAIGKSVNAKWNAVTGWSLELGGQTYKNSAVNGSVPTTVLLIPISGGVLLLADGRQVFAVQSQIAISGECVLSAQGELNIANPVTYRSPQLSVIYKNGNRRDMQYQVLNDTRCLVKEKCYDALGNCVAETKIAAFDNTLFGYRKDFVSRLDSITGVMSGEVSNFYSEDEGYPYSGTRYEASSLSRPVKKGLPGKAFATTESNSHVTQYSYAVTDQKSVANIPYRAGELLVTALTDANGSQVLAIQDRRGQVLGKQTTAGGAQLDAVQQVFDTAGNISKILHPNDFSASGNHEVYTTHNQYNFLGQLTARTTQDAGETRYIYDSAGRLRFSSTPLTLAAGTVLYKKYDVLGRISEEGEIQQTWGDGSHLQIIADTDPDYPQYDRWETKNYYDGTGDDPTQRGRLWKTEKRNPDDCLIENSYGYDVYGNTVVSTLNVPGESAQTTSYRYNNLGNIAEIHYPAGSAVPQVVYTYNDIGQNVAIGTEQTPDKFARYRYHADGSLAQEQLNTTGSRPLTRAVSYNSPGWITAIDNQYADGSPLLKHRFSYTSEGYNGAGYYNGNIASATLDNAIAPDRSFIYRYQYDQRSQLMVAQHSVHPEYSLGIGDPLAFDPNGNILSLKRGNALYTYDYQKDTNKVMAVKQGSTVTQCYQYDTVGNVSASSHRHISQIAYNTLNNLPLHVALEDGNALTLAYNGINQRVLKKHSDGSQTLYVHGLSHSPLVESGNSRTQYIYGIGGLLLIVQDGESLYVLKDQQGSVRAVIAEDGTVKTMLDYMPFGQRLPNSVGTPEIVRYRFTGQEFDDELALYNYRARFYDPELGRFYSCDPRFQYASPFVYANNNPVNQTDPSGEIAPILAILIAGAVIGALIGGGTALYTGLKADLSGGALVGYVALGIGIGAAAGALSAAGGVGAFAAGSAAAAATTTTAGGIAAGIAAGAAVGGAVGGVVGAAQGVSQHFVNDAFGVANNGSWQDAMIGGLITGAIGGAIAGGVSGAGGAIAVQQAARFAELSGQAVSFSPSSLTQVSEAYSSFGSMGIIPLPSFVSRIPNVNAPIIGRLQTFVLSKFSLPTLSALPKAAAQKAVSPLLPTSGGSGHSSSQQSQLGTFYGQQAYNPSMSGSVGMQPALIMNPSSWNNDQA
ncbi:RHS repeat-associated core domain-containing protein [Pectobacterium versatile]|uniref:RHS repeat domain-containing protein n=1 Tax=Pectobacterium versatile TaxID=2488639 RepID=UPI00196902FC|nr:RHS repeat-associated core domain-containing protein [Pectobacterium versatile]MBN3236812.1 RHS repeat-associated core domain-containing protein [Pectobacterium versatile]